jgi:hypothetical protein
LIAALIKDPDVDILQMLPKSSKLAVVSVSSWDKSAVVGSFFSITYIPQADSDSAFKILELILPSSLLWSTRISRVFHKNLITGSNIIQIRYW